MHVDTDKHSYIIKYDDIPDFIVDYNDRFGQTDLTFYNPEIDLFNPFITTYGSFLNYCEPKVRSDIIDRLIKLQLYEEKVKDYKVTNTHAIEDITMKIDKGINI